MIEFATLKDQLVKSFEDEKLDVNERRELLATCKTLDKEKRAFIRNRAFDLAKERCRNIDNGEHTKNTLNWLENIVKTIDASVSKPVECKVYFSPGDECLNALENMINRTMNSLEVCVFTISENKIRDALIKAHKRQVLVRIISDNDKSADLGSDITFLAEQGLQVRIDNTRHHMHHKFVISDNKYLATGSFNWTRSASLYNHENIILLNDTHTVSEFKEEFEKLWLEFSD